MPKYKAHNIATNRAPLVIDRGEWSWRKLYHRRFSWQAAKHFPQEIIPMCSRKYKRELVETRHLSHLPTSEEFLIKYAFYQEDALIEDAKIDGCSSEKGVEK